MLPDKKWSEIFELAKAEKALDADSIALLFEIEQRNTSAARELLALAADNLQTGKKLPRLVALYLAYSLRSIALGEDPAKALHLKLNGRAGTSRRNLMRFFFTVERFKQEGAPSEKEAIGRAGAQIGLNPAAAEKRFAIAKEQNGPAFKGLSNAMRARGVRVPSLVDALSGTGAKNAADDLIETMVRLLSEPKEGT